MCQQVQTPNENFFPFEVDLIPRYHLSEAFKILRSVKLVNYLKNISYDKELGLRSSSGFSSRLSPEQYHFGFYKF